MCDREGGRHNVLSESCGCSGRLRGRDESG
jgi:hypothetical protein